MTTRGDWERYLYRALTGNRLGHASHNVRNAMRALAGVSKTPWSIAGVSRETWRRWSKGEQQPGPKSRAGLLAALRRLRMSPAREAKLRGGDKGKQVTITAKSNYEDGVTRVVGPRTVDWRAGANGKIVDAFLRHGIGAAVDALIGQQPGQGAVRESHFAEWLHPQADGSGQSYDLQGIDLQSSPGRGDSTRA